MNQTISKSMILITVVLMELLSGMEFDLFVPSFPELHDQFSLTPFLVELLLSVNFLGYCVSLFFVGGLADRHGRKPVILSGLITFVVGSMFCLFASSFIFLLFGRLFQGIGIAAPAILSFLIIADSYPLKQQQFLMAILNGSINLGVGAAPVIGSYVTLYFNWHGNFALLSMLGGIALVMVTFFVPNKQQQHVETVSLTGLRGYFSIFQSKALLLLMTNLLLIFVPYWIFVGMSPLLYIKDLGVTLSHFGYYQGALALIFAIGTILYGLMIKNADYDQREMIKISIQILIISLIVVGLVTYFNSNNPLIITFSILVFVIGQIIPSVILYSICLNFIPHAKGRVSAMIQGARLVLTAITLQIAGYFYDGSFQNIGIIICVIILMAIITSIFVLRNNEIMAFSRD